MDVDEPESTPASPDPEEFEEAQSPSQMADEAMSEESYSESGLQSPKGDPMETDMREQQQKSGACTPESEYGDDQSGPGSPGEQGSDDDQASDQYSNGHTNSEPRSRNSSEGEESGTEGGSWSPRQSPEGQPPDGSEEPVPAECSENKTREDKDSEHEMKAFFEGIGENNIDDLAKDDQQKDSEKSEPADDIDPDEAVDEKISAKGSSRLGSGRSTINKKSSEKSSDCTKSEGDMHASVLQTDSTLDNEDGEQEKEDSLNLSKSSLHDDHGELDYDEEIHEESGENLNKKIAGKDEVREIPAAEGSKDEDEDGERKTDEEDDGELDDDDCEEGEIKEPGNRRPFVRPLCRFYNRGNCTWGSSCRFLHPGVNDKGNYSLIERPAPPGIHSRLGPVRHGTQWGSAADRGTVVEPELPPPPEDPPTESAWERGLRHAKELMKRANKRKETETNFEEKRLNLSLEDEKEFNKENDRGRFVKDPYYDNVYEEEDEYYSKAWGNSSVAPPQASQNWHSGHYENFEVRWTREPEFGAPFRGPPPVPDRERLRERHHRERRFSPETERIRTTVHPPSAVLPPMDRHMSPETERIRYEKRREERNERFEKFDRYEKYEKYEKFDRAPVYDRPLPYVREERPERINRSQREDRGDREDRIDRMERLERIERLERLERSERPERQEEPMPVNKMRGDEWHDPWRRAGHQSKVSKPVSPKRRRSTSRSRSRGRRRYRSFSRGSRGSSSSSYSSSSYSSRSRSRSSSYSSYSSRSSNSRSSSSSRSSSRSRSRTPSKVKPSGPQNNHRERRPPMPVKPGEAPKSTVTVKPGLRGGPPGGRSGPAGSPHNPRGAPAPRGGPRGGPPGGPTRPAPQRSPEKKKSSGAPAGHLLVPGPPPPTGPKGGAPPAVKPGPLQDRGRPREREPPARAMPKRRSYSASSSGSSSRSRSFSSSSSRSRSGSASSVSSMSSSSSSSSSGSADSEHLYRDIASGHSSATSTSPSRNAGAKKDSPHKKVSKPKEARPQAGPGVKAERKRPGEKREAARGPPGREPPPGVGDGRQRDVEREAEREKRPFQGGRGMPEEAGRQRRGADLGPAGRGNPSRTPPAPGRSVGRADPAHPSGSENVGRGGRPGAGGRHNPRGGGVGRGMREEHISRMDQDNQESSLSQAQLMKTAKDPLKMSGQKSNIKLTLISKSSDKASGRKRPAPDAPGGPSNKRTATAAPVAKPAPLKEMKAGQKAPPSVRQPEKPVVKPVIPKGKVEVSKAVPGAVPVVAAIKRPEPVAKPASLPTPAQPAAPKPAGPASATKASKSTSSRREELLKQLKVVEDAIARKRAKVQ